MCLYRPLMPQQLQHEGELGLLAVAENLQVVKGKKKNNLWCLFACSLPSRQPPAPA